MLLSGRASSSLAGGTNHGGSSSIGGVPDCGSGGWGFETPLSPQIIGTGSTPSGVGFVSMFHMKQSLKIKEVVLRIEFQDYGSSNLSFSTIHGK